MTRSLLTEVFKAIPVQPLWYLLPGESLQNHTVRGSEVILDICARWFWEASQEVFFDVRVFNPNGTRYAKLQFSKSYQINEKEKKKYYNERTCRLNTVVSHLL